MSPGFLRRTHQPRPGELHRLGVVNLSFRVRVGLNSASTQHVSRPTRQRSSRISAPVLAVLACGLPATTLRLALRVARIGLMRPVVARAVVVIASSSSATATEGRRRRLST
jgi:hypothetical protein